MSDLQSVSIILAFLIGIVIELIVASFLGMLKNIWREKVVWKNREYGMKKYSILIIVVCLNILFCKIDVKASDETKIHFIALDSSSDAILLESNGKYGMIDSGEDWDFPTGQDFQYPAREGIIKWTGYEQQVIHYLEEVGVEELEFYIATHAHSDHIGTGNEILDYFPTKYLYVSEYKDEWISSTNRLWDNQYVYDQLIEAANRNGTEIITHLDQPENVDRCTFQMGDMQLKIMNYERERDESGNIIPVGDDNWNALVVLIQAKGKNVLLASDLDPSEGDTAKIANILIEELWDDCGIKEDKVAEQYDIEECQEPESISCEDYPETAMNVKRELPSYNERNVNTGFDEWKPNLNNRIRLDLLKLPHHGEYHSNTPYFLTSLNPKIAVATAESTILKEEMRKYLLETEIYATGDGEYAALLVDFQGEELSVKNVKLKSGWNQTKDGEWRYCDDNGKALSKWQYIDGEWYWFDKSIMQTGWQYLGKWFYFDESGRMKTGWQYLGRNWYFLNKSGDMLTGWQYLGEHWYYLNDLGQMLTDWQYLGENWYYLSDSGQMLTGWQYLGGNWYYLSDSGQMLTGWQYLEGNWYYLNSSGQMLTGWQYLGGNWYYLNSSGQMLTGRIIIDGVWYIFDSSGMML